MTDPRLDKRDTRSVGDQRADHARPVRRSARLRTLGDAGAEAEMLRKENAELRAKLQRLEWSHANYEIYERSPFAYLCLDPISRVVHVNQAAHDMLGDDGHLVGSLFTRYLSAESRNRFLMHLHACRHANHAASEFDLRLRTLRVELQIDVITRVERSDSLRYHTVVVPSSVRARLGHLLPRNDRTDELARAVHSLEAQQAQLALQNQRLRATQHLLEESRDRYLLLYEFSPVGYLSLDEAGHVLALNLTAAVMLGAERMDVAGYPLARHIVADDIGRFEVHLRQCRSGMPQVKSELRLDTSSGCRDVELISVKVESDQAEAPYHTAMTDITDRKHAVEALRESETKLRWLIDNMPAVLWIQDERGSPRYVSANVAHILGYSEYEVRSGGARFWLSNIHPDDRERVELAYSRMFGSGESAGPAAYDIEYRRQAKDGSWIWVVDRGMSISEENGVRYATGMLWDTTRRKRMQEQLRESEERFRQLAENINDVFFLTDLDGTRIFYVSSAFERLWGFSAEALYARPRSWLELIHAPDRRRVRRALKARERDAPYDIEFRIRRPNGALRWIRMRGFPILDADGHVYRFAGIAADITERKDAADKLQRSHQRMRELALHLQSVREEERKRIAREIHDDLGALLLAIKLDLEAIRKVLVSGRGASGIDMAESIGRVDMAIDSVRRMATDLRPSILDQLGVVAAVEWQAQDTERRTGIKCDVEVDAGKEELDIEPERATAIFRIVQEALANVVRHSGATQVRIALHERDGSVALEITDNGKGIDADGASGLHKWGLIGMAERVASFKGRFGVTPAQPRGTTVSVWIPTAGRPSSQAAMGRL